MKKQLHELTFTELVDEATREAHSELLKSGGSGLRSTIWLYMNTAINWHKETTETKKKK